MVAARKRENQNRINDKIYLIFYGKKTLQYHYQSTCFAKKYTSHIDGYAAMFV